MSDHTTQELDRVTRKIKHCLALPSSCNEHEAATALHLARTLIRTHRLTKTAIALSEVHKTEGENAQAKLPTWDTALSSVVAEAFHCKPLEKSFWCREALKKLRRVVFVGISPAPELAKYAYDALLLKLAFARQELFTKINEGELPQARHTPTARANHYALAWVGTIHNKLLAPDIDSVATLDDGQQKTLLLTEANENELIDEYLMSMTGGADNA